LEGIKINRHQIDWIKTAFTRFRFVFRVATLVEKPAVDAGMQRLYTAIEHFRKRCETRDLAHRNFFFPQQDRCPTCGNDIYTLALQRAGKRGDTGFVRNGNERAADFHADVNRDSLNRYINSRLTNYDPRKASAIEKDIPGRRIQHRAAADGF